MSDYDISQKFWRNEHNVLHREDGPAIVVNGNKYWYQNGRRHREDGPAIEFKNGDVEYWIDGKKVIEIEYFVKFGVVNG